MTSDGFGVNMYPLQNSKIPSFESEPKNNKRRKHAGTKHSFMGEIETVIHPLTPLQYTRLDSTTTTTSVTKNSSTLDNHSDIILYISSKGWETRRPEPRILPEDEVDEVSAKELPLRRLQQFVRCGADVSFLFRCPIFPCIARHNNNHDNQYRRHQSNSSTFSKACSGRS